MKFVIASALALLLIGCNSTSKSYQVSVKNQSPRPVTLWLSKDGPPAEEGWFTPEQIVSESRQLRYDLAFVPPGKTGYTGKMTGEFPKGTNAVLRVYDGEQEVFDLAKEPAASTHADQVLKPGNNHLAVVERDGKLVIEPSK
jgi:hypothetical protein